MVNVIRAIGNLYPTARPLEDFLVRDDGNGPYIKHWNLPYPEPSADELAVADYDPATVPHSVSMRQARLALLAAGLLGNVTTAINALPSPQKEAALIEWEYSQEVQRDKSLVKILAPELGLSETQIDDLFIAASKM